MSLDLFDGIFRKHKARMAYTAFCIVRDHHLAEDIVQESFIKAYNKLDTVHDTSRLGAWLSAITARTAIDFLRKEKRVRWAAAEEGLLEQAATGWSTEDEVEIRLFKEDVTTSVTGMANEYREVLVLKLQYGLKEKEIAGLLELKSATVKTRLHRARKQLRTAISEKYPA